MKKQLFNDNWMLLHGSGSALAALFGGTGENPEPVTLPHDAIISTERVNTPLGGGMGFYQGKNINYLKKFTLPIEAADKVVWFEFEGVYQNAFVYINDSFAGRCTYGYSNYFINATNFVKFGAENTIKVVVKNEVTSGRWYTGGGIYRNVSILLGDKLHFKCEGSKVHALVTETDQAVICVEAPIEYVGYKAVGTVMVTEILDADGSVVSSDRASYHSV